MADWAAEQAPELLAQARREALELARAQLRDELTAELLAAVVALRRPASGDLVWVYGVTDGGVPDVPGVDGHAVAGVGSGALTALVSRVPRAEFDQAALKAGLEDLQRLEALARGHERVLAAALDAGPVVPFAICTIYEAADRVQAMLAERGDALSAALDAVRGCSEWSVKVLHRPVQTEPLEPVASGVEYLARKRSSRDEANAATEAVVRAAEGVHARLTEHAVDAVLERPQDRRLSGHEGEMVLNGAYLVADARSDEFRALVEELAERHEADGLHFTLSGPWPAHHFTSTA